MKLIFWCTSAGDSSILVMPTVVLSPAQAFAFCQVLFSSVAVDIIQQNQTSSVAKVGVAICVDSITTAYLLTHHLGIVEDPVIITHRSPVSLVVDLHPALTGILSIHQANRAVIWTKRENEILLEPILWYRNIHSLMKFYVYVSWGLQEESIPSRIYQRIDRNMERKGQCVS